MAGTLTAENFAKLLACFDSDRNTAGEKYEELRRTLIRFFEWRGAPFAEEQTDEAFNRVARKLDEGLEIRNIRGYCHQVARLICFEALKGVDNRMDPLDADLHDVVTAETDDAVEDEILLTCLDTCLKTLPPDGRTLILEYYPYDSAERIERRKALAVTLKLNREALANRAQRLRDRIERCVTDCFNKTVI